MSAETEQGLNALQSGNAAEAVTLLERATQSDPTDYQAFMYLGAAYGQVERHNDSISALTQAVVLQPSNAQGRYNLGTAMERAGHIPQALEAYQQAIQLQSDYAKAREAAQRLEGGSSPAPGFAAPTETPTQYAPPASGYAPPAETPTQYAPQGYAQQTPQYAPPTQYAPPPEGYAPQPGQQMQGYGQQPPAYGQPTMMTPGQPPAYGQPPVYPGGFAPGAYRGGNTFVEDRFDLKQAAKDWVQIICAPKTFFEGQTGRTGFMAPLAFLLFTLLAQSIAALLSLVFNPAMFGLTLIGIGIKLTIGYALTVLLALIGAVIYHAVGKMFGNKADVSGSFRALVYCQAPWMIVTVLLGLASPLLNAGQANPMGLIMPEKPGIYLKQSQNDSAPPSGLPNGRYNRPGGYNGGSYSGGATQKSPFDNPAMFGGIMALGVFGLLLMLAFFIWNFVLLVMAISSIQQISTGSAVGVVVTIILIAIVLAVIAVFAVGGLIAAALAGKH